MSTVTNSLNKVFFRQSATPEYSIASQDAGTVFYGTIIDGALLIDDSGDGTRLQGPFQTLVPYQDGDRVAFTLRGQRPMILTVEGGFQASDAYAGLTSQTQDNAELIAGSREILDAHTEHLGEVDQWVEDTNSLLEATDHIVEGLGAEVERTKVTVAGAVTAADGALHVANLATEFAEGLVDMSPTQPVNPPVGQIWIPTNEQGQGTGVSRWNGSAWETVTNLVGLLIVPTADGGQTLVGPDGVETTQVLADLIRTKVLYVEEAGVETLVVTGIPRENLADDVNEALGTAEDLGSRIVLDGQAGTLTIARNQDADSSALTALRLSATNLDFISAGEVAAYIDATRNQFFIRNAYVQDTLQIGEHQVRRLGQNNITVFQWVGV